MITYLYWSGVLLLTGLAFYVIGAKGGKWKIAAGVAAVFLVTGWAAYYFRFEQMFVKRYGGVMAIRVPEGQYHLNATWKDDNLWIENYDPETNTCIFSEYSRGNMLEGRVTIKNCNPLLPQ